MQRLPLIFLLELMLIEVCVSVSGPCPNVPSCTCDSQGTAECTHVCPSNAAIPRDIKVLRIANYTCTSTIMIKPDDLGYYPILEELDLSNNSIKSLYYAPPNNLPTFMNMPNLKVISLAHNSIVSFNAKIFTNLSHLESLDLSYNLLGGVATNVTSAGWPTLKTFNLANNKVKSLTAASLAGVKTLETLILSNNPITNIDSEAFKPLTNLHTIQIEGLPLTEIPAAIFANPQTLKEVIASNMSVSTLPDNILYGTFLDKLDLAHDSFTSIPTTAIKNCTKQPRLLDLSYNKITQISGTDLQGLTVQTLDLSGNPIVQVDDKAFDGSTLSHIDLSNTGLTSLPATMETWLRSTTATVNLDNTNWLCTCDTIWLARVVDQKTNITPPKCAVGGKYGGTSLKDSLPQMETDCASKTTATTNSSASLNGIKSASTTTPETTTGSSPGIEPSQFIAVFSIIVLFML